MALFRSSSRLCANFQKVTLPRFLPQMFQMSTGVDVKHSEERKEFFIELGKDKAVLQYEVLNPTTVDLWHTEVPVSLRGKGLAQILAKAAFDYVSEKDLKAKVTCTYLIKYLNDTKNPQYLKHVVE